MYYCNRGNEDTSSLKFSTSEIRTGHYRDIMCTCVWLLLSCTVDCACLPRALVKALSIVSLCSKRSNFISRLPQKHRCHLNSCLEYLGEVCVRRRSDLLTLSLPFLLPPHSPSLSLLHSLSLHTLPPSPSPTLSLPLSARRGEGSKMDSVWPNAVPVPMCSLLTV